MRSQRPRRLQENLNRMCASLIHSLKIVKSIKYKATSTELKKDLDSELRNRDLIFWIQISDIQAGDLKQKITSVLKSNLTKIESSLKDGGEFDMNIQKEFEKIQRSEESRRTGHFRIV